MVYAPPGRYLFREVLHIPEGVTLRGSFGDAAPIAYPCSIAMRGKNPAAFDLELVNPYQGIDASH